MKLRTKLLAAYAAILVLTGAVVVSDQYTARSTLAEFTELMDTESAMARSARTAHDALAHAEAATTEFLREKDTAQRAVADVQTALMVSEAQHIAQIAREHQFDANEDEALKIAALAKDYGDAFHKLVDAWDIMGLDHKSGLQGAFRSVVHDLESTSTHTPESEALLLEVRRREKDYLLRRDEKYVTMTSEAVAAFDAHVVGLDLPDWRKSAIRAQTQKYERGFLSLVEQDRRVHVLSESMDAAAAAVREAADEILEHAEGAEAQRRTDIQAAASGRMRTSLVVALFAVVAAMLLSLVLFRVTTSLERLSESGREQNWFDAGKTGLNDQMRGELPIPTLLGNVVTYLAKYTDSQVGAVYLLDGERLRLLSSYAYEKRKRLSNDVAVGEGLVGQAAFEKEPILLTDVPEDYVAVTSGLGATAPRQVMVLPLLHDNDVMGVLELGAIHAFSDAAQELLKSVAADVGVAIHSARAAQRVRELLEESQQQAEELQAQQEELQQANAELEEQTSALQDSENQLLEQQQRLELVNSELEERTEALDQERRLVGERNERLQTASRELETKAEELALSSRYKSEFLANMSHDLRTPLNSILILSKLLADNAKGNLSEKQVRFAHTIRDSGNGLLSLINEILDLSKVESGKMQLVIEEVDFDDFLGVIKRQFAPSAEQKGLAFSVHRDPAVPEQILTDETRLGQVVRNLLSNAIKFTETGEVRVDVTPATLPPAVGSPAGECGGGMAIRIIDTGIGVPEDKHQAIFEPFQQADGTTNRKYGGTGLGLSICRELVKLLGGELTMESDAGSGTTFTLVLPTGCPEVHRQDVPAATAPQQAGPVAKADSPPPPEPTPTRPETEAPPEANVLVPDDRDELDVGDRSVLVIEDDPRFARVLSDLAHTRGFRCLIAGSGHDGLELARRYLPSGILLDLGLPGMDGVAVLSRLKDDLTTRHIPVHIISAHDEKEDALKLGAVGFVSKPVNVKQLDDVFQRIEDLGARRVRQLLVVDDDSATCTAVRELIGDKDVEVTTATTAGEALELLRSRTFDCLVLDLTLPDGSGVELLVRIRRLESTADLPVVILTGKELTKDEQLTLDRYADRVIMKGERSPERLLDETALFLHRVEDDLPEEKRRMLRLMHDKESIFNGRKLLLVDDDMRNIFALSAVLEEKGFDLVVATDGKEALARLADTPGIDLILMDIMMPTMDGYECMRRIRTQPEHAELPILALTAKAMKGDRGKCIEAGASDYLSKPVDTERLLSMLRVWLYPASRRSLV